MGNMLLHNRIKGRGSSRISRISSLAGKSNCRVSAFEPEAKFEPEKEFFEMSIAVRGKKKVER